MRAAEHEREGRASRKGVGMKRGARRRCAYAIASRSLSSDGRVQAVGPELVVERMRGRQTPKEEEEEEEEEGMVVLWSGKENKWMLGGEWNGVSTQTDWRM